MGSINRASRCERFIGEFKDDILRTYRLHVGQKFRLQSVNVGMDGGDEVVRLFVELQRLTGGGKETTHFIEMEVTNDLFNPEEDPKAQLEDIQANTGIATQTQVKRRMKKADLLR
jgi:hypothetical protein